VPDPTIAIVGAGRLGQALGRLLRENNQNVVAVASRSLNSARRAASFIGDKTEAVPIDQIPARATHILIATPDSAITDVARQLAEAGMNGGVALHTCGALGPDALAPLAAAGTACGLLHPLQTIPNPEAGVYALTGVAFSIDGDRKALNWANRIVDLFDGIALRIPADKKTVYHAAAVMASNYTVALMDAALELMEDAGVRRDVARQALRPLVESSVANALNESPGKALTGPIRRGDAATVSAHLSALDESHAALYLALGRHTVALARRAGLDEAAARQLRQALRENEDLDA